RGLHDSPRGLRVLDEVGLGPSGGEVDDGHRYVALVHEREGADPPLGQPDERRAEGRRVDAVADGEPLAAALELARRDGLDGDEQVVEPARPGEAGVVGGVEDAARFGEGLLGVRQRDGLEEPLGRGAGPAAEQPLGVERAQPDVRRHVGQRRLAVDVRAEVGDGRLDAAVVSGFHGRGDEWAGSLPTAAVARRPETCAPPGAPSCHPSPKAPTPRMNISTAMAVSTIPISRSMATRPRCPRNPASRLARSRMAAVAAHASTSAPSPAIRRPGSLLTSSITLAIALGPATNGMASGTTNGSPSTSSASVPCEGKIIRSAMRKRMMPPAMVSAGSEMPRTRSSAGP